jgi:hypothetical protein
MAIPTNGFEAGAILVKVTPRGFELARRHNRVETQWKNSTNAKPKRSPDLG